MTILLNTRLQKNKLGTSFLVAFVALLLITIPILVYASTHAKINTSSRNIAPQKISKNVKHKFWTKNYDKYFKKYSKHYFGRNYSWHWFKAQAIAESNLQEKATSKVGAVGLMQILPSTYKDIIKKNPIMGDIKHPKWNVAGGIFYDRQLYRKWKNKGIPVSERLAFTFASYNAGYTKVLRAFNKSNKNAEQQVYNWADIKKDTPGATRAYVYRIKGLMNY
jgi:membrane-bound lytic murein transglycosylase F